MDHILANSDNPVPPAEEQFDAPTTNDGDEDEDKEGLAAHIKKMGGNAGEELVANVCIRLELRGFQWLM
jgi:hypothetical protein